LVHPLPAQHLLVVFCSLVAVVWQLGLLPLLGYQLDPYSVLVPFLVFAIGMSHGAQKMNGIMQDIGRGMHRVVAARFTFRRLFLAGLTALLCDAVGFAVLMLIDIQVIQDLAVIASIGVAVLIFTNLILLPVLLSYIGVSPVRRNEPQKRNRTGRPASSCLLAFPRSVYPAPLGQPVYRHRPGPGGRRLVVSLQLKIGDLDAGAPELRADSRYNLDNAFLTRHTAQQRSVCGDGENPASSCAIRHPGQGGCPGLATARLAGRGFDQLPGTAQPAHAGRPQRRQPKWYELQNNQAMLNMITASAPAACTTKTAAC
jgi:hypothetical protein